MKSYTSARTEVRRVETLEAGDRFIDLFGPGRHVLTVLNVERFDHFLWVDAQHIRRVERRFEYGTRVEVCIPYEA